MRIGNLNFKEEMDMEQKQAEIIEQLLTRASSCHGEEALGPILEGTHLDVLRLFAHGTWADYKRNASRFPHLAPPQILKLKQLTLLTLAQSNKVLPYDTLMLELDVTNVRDLEDFLINECMYAGIVRGKLDQLKRCFQVPFAAGRDPTPGQLGTMLHTLSTWLNTSENLLVSIQDKIKWADNMGEVDTKHRNQAQEKVDKMRKSLSVKEDADIRGHKEMFVEASGMMDYEQDGIRPKRRRHPVKK